MASQLLLFLILGHILTGLTMYNSSNAAAMSDVTKSDKKFCTRKYNFTWMEFICSHEFLLDDVDIDIDDLNPTELESIESLSIKARDNNRGPLSTIPSKICRFPKLKNLYLSLNSLRSANFNFTIPCLSELRSLDLSNNLITNISVQWLEQLPLVEHVYLSSNKLIDLPYNIFNNVSHLRTLDVARNNLTTFELWTIQIRDKVDYRRNRINGFSNKYNVDLSNLQTEKLPQFYVDEDLTIQFDDTIFEMYNRCAEVSNIPNFFTIYIPTFTLAVLSILKSTDNEQSFYKTCSCDQFNLYRTAFAIEGYPNNVSFDSWICPGHSKPFVQQCNNRSSARFIDVIPRLCKIDDSEPGDVPVYISDQKSTTTISATTARSTTITTEKTTRVTQQTTTTTTDLTTTTSSFPMEPVEIVKHLENITELNNSTVQNFTSIINNAHNKQNITDGSNISEKTKIIYQKIILRIEHLIESLNSSLNISDAAVALVSSTKNDPVYHFNQLILSNSSTIYSSESDYNNSIASISIDEIYINQLSDNKFYSFYFLPSSFFHYAQVDSRIEIVSPIVGASLPIESSLHVQMSFIDHNLPRSSGSYSCAFWQVDRWNDTGCIYSHNSTTSRHCCHCDHLTSFALIFTPNGLLRETFLPTIITSCFSMIGLFISIILSAHQQTKPQVNHQSRRFSIVNLLSLSSTLILFILFTALLISNYQSSTTPSTTPIPCSSSKLNLVLTTYFFVILTFITKTLLGIYYYFTTFVQFKPHLFNDRSDRCYVVSLLMIIMIALIPSVVASILSHQQNNVIVSNSRVCWFHGIYLINFITIPVSLLIGVNVIIVILISIRLFQFLCNTTADHAKEKRLIIATCMWIASCVLLGIIWIVGPLLNLFVNDNGQSTSTASKAMQWIFALLTGLEGVWVLIVNILFYVRHRPKQQPRWPYSSNSKTKWQRIDNLGRLSVDTYDNQKATDNSL